MNTCKNCAWYCHSDGRCYGNLALLAGEEIGCVVDINRSCRKWSFDGLEDWERDQLDPSNMESLMTMKKTTA